ncbi:MAG: TIGR03032 family protein [Pirellulaceae bacterium]|nr:TIGR03032 family protein [Pirellulaceae bacterium]
MMRAVEQADATEPGDRTSGMREVRFEYSPDFPGILQHLNATLAITTYQAGKLVLVGADADRLVFTFHGFEQAMGVAVAADALAVGSRRAIHLLRPAHDIAAGIQPAGTHDAVWLTRQTFHTGAIQSHEMEWGRDGLWIVNTLFSTLCTLHENYNFVPRWRPPFISVLEANDRCHLNGLAMDDGLPRFVTAHGQSDEPAGWRTNKASGGVVIDVTSGETVARNLAMPHSPRIAHGRLWLLNSGAGQLMTVDPARGRCDVVADFPGYVRGLAFHGQFAFVGLSKIRERSVFGGLPIERDRANLRCGLAVFDLATAKTVAVLQFHSGVDEIFAVSVLPGCRRPCLAGPNDTDEAWNEIWLLPLSARTPSQPLPAAPEAPADAPGARAAQCVAAAQRLHQQGRLHEALQAYRQALEIDPNRAAVHCNLGNLWQELDDQHQAIGSYRQALELDPELVPARQNLGYLLFNHGRTEEAVAVYEALLERDPSPMNRMLDAGVLPVVYQSAADVDRWRQRLSERLDGLLADGAVIDTTATLAPTSFFLAYQGRNDAEIMRRIGRIHRGPELVPPADGPLCPRSDGRLRVGFLSAYFRDHTIGRLNLGRIRHLDRRRFEVTVLSATGRQDAVAADFRTAGDRYVPLEREVSAARQRIADQDLDVLIFADVGMDSLTSTLARSRMAAVQCVTWGHPDTTGSPHIDYFLSSELLELPEADGHYSERLVRLPRLATHFPRPALVDVAPPLDRSQRQALASGFGLDPQRHHYLCPQTLFKLHPDFDAVLAAIIEADPRAEIVLLEGRVQHWTALLRERFQRTLPDGDRRIRWLPAQPRDAFLRLLAAADVVLDPLHFGGGHTSYEALALAAPVVTLPGEFLRGRITQALYRAIELTDLITETPEAYVETAGRLAGDESFRRKICTRIAAAAGVLYENPAEVDCLADWLWSLTTDN